MIFEAMMWPRRCFAAWRFDLITNNPLKIAGLVDGGIPVRRRIPLTVEHNPHNKDYLKAKQEHSGHLIEMFPDDPDAKAS